MFYFVSLRHPTITTVLLVLLDYSWGWALRQMPMRTFSLSPTQYPIQLDGTPFDFVTLLSKYLPVQEMAAMYIIRPGFGCTSYEMAAL